MSERMDDLLFDFWAQLDRSGSADPGALDPTLADTIRHLHDLSLAPVPDATRERIRRKVLDQSVSTEGEPLVTLSAAALPLPSSNGHRKPAPAAPAPRAISTRARPKWAWAMLAAALLLLLGGIGSYFASGNHALFGASGPVEPNPIPAATVESGWPQFRGGPARTGYTADPGPGGNLDLRWTFTADDVLSNVVTDGNSAYIYGRRGNLFALDATTGAQRWALDLSPNEYSDENRWPIPAVDDGVLYTGTFDGNMVAIHAQDGTVLWQRSLGNGPIVSSPLVLDDQLLVISPSGSVVRLDPATGDTIWEWTGDTELSDWAPAAGGGLFYMADLGGDLVAIDTATGTTKWVADLNDARRNPAYADGMVYIGGDSRSFYALDASDGSIVWKTDPAEGDQGLNPIVTPDAVIATFMNGPMNALDLKTGAVLWTAEGPGESRSPHASALALYAASADLTSLVAYDLNTGAELGRISADGLGSVAAISGDTIIYGNADDGGAVRAIGPSDSKPVDVTAGPATAIPAVTSVATTAPVIASPSTTFDGSQVQLLWQSTGSTETPLKYPGGSAIGPDGNLYLADQALETIQVFAPDGSMLEPWSGSAPFSVATSIVFDNDGNSYVVETGKNRIQKFAPDGALLLEWGSTGDGTGQFDEPNMIAIDPELGRLYVTEFMNNRVQVFDLDGNFIDKWGSLGSKAGQFVHPAGIAVSADGLIVVGDTQDGQGGRVQVFDQYGTFQAELPEIFTEVWALAYDAAGNLYVADYGNNSIEVYDPELQHIGTIENVADAGPFKHITGMTFDVDGNLYVSDLDNSRLLKLQMPTSA